MLYSKRKKMQPIKSKKIKIFGSISFSSMVRCQKVKFEVEATMAQIPYIWTNYPWWRPASIMKISLEIISLVWSLDYRNFSLIKEIGVFVFPHKKITWHYYLRISLQKSGKHGSQLQNVLNIKFHNKSWAAFDWSFALQRTT